MDNMKYWDDIPIGKENAITYPELCTIWNIPERSVRYRLHELSRIDTGDDYILIRSAAGRGFYKTDNLEEIKAYKAECLHRGRSVFAPVRKINRILAASGNPQYSIENNLRVVRETSGLKQREVCAYLKKHNQNIDKSMLSKMENNICIPLPYQLYLLAQLYGVSERDLINTELY